MRKKDPKAAKRRGSTCCLASTCVSHVSQRERERERERERLMDRERKREYL
jgi:hypothetical protein